MSDCPDRLDYSKRETYFVDKQGYFQSQGRLLELMQGI